LARKAQQSQPDDRLVQNYDLGLGEWYFIGIMLPKGGALGETADIC
jgi:hypothetical protein